ncbi:hypothetical protein BDV59DRAFT_202720 [Aspergillus ambiguus]|uniref:uncharacterized protein n=1 Tax=Aspergillus ambiguus TaxID=176160 RepID=UPI003CCE53AD
MCLPYLQLEDHKLTTFTWFVHFPLAGYVLKGPPKTPNEIYSTAIRELNRKKHSIWTTPCDKVKLTGGMIITMQAPLNNKKLFRQAIEKELYLQLRQCLNKHFSVGNGYVEDGIEASMSDIGGGYASATEDPGYLTAASHCDDGLP